MFANGETFPDFFVLRRQLLPFSTPRQGAKESPIFKDRAYFVLPKREVT